MEPISLAVVGTLVLTEGVKFLYSQAGEALKRWRGNRDDPVPVPADPPIQGELKPAKIDAEAMGTMADEMEALYRELAPYNDPNLPKTVDANDAELIEKAEAMRRALEVVLGQRIRFKGESGQSGPLVEGEANVDDVYGYVAGVRARSISGGAAVRGTVTAKTVRPGGQATGVDAGDIG